MSQNAFLEVITLASVKSKTLHIPIRVVDDIRCVFAKIPYTATAVCDGALSMCRIHELSFTSLAIFGGYSRANAPWRLNSISYSLFGLVSGILSHHITVIEDYGFRAILTRFFGFPLRGAISMSLVLFACRTRNPCSVIMYDAFLEVGYP